MGDWKPKQRADIALHALNLSGEEGFVLSRIDGASSLVTLSHLTGLPEPRVRAIVDKLVAEGAVEGTAGGLGGAPRNRHADVDGAAPPPPPSATPPEEELSPEELRALVAEALGSDEGAAEPDTAEGDPDNDDVTPPEGSARDDDVIVDAADDAQGDEARGDDAPADDATDAADSGSGEGDDDGTEEGDPIADAVQEANARQLFETELHKLDADIRVAMAKDAEDPQLAAFCFDPMAPVIHAILENARTGPSHARLIARHHRTAAGLEMLLSRHELGRDAQVQKLLLANPQLQEPQLRKILHPKRLADCFKLTVNRDLPERTRQKVRHILRNKWSIGEAEERAGLIFSTEGRCLLQLTGLPFDSKTTSLLCARTYNSSLIIQNLARFSTTPPQVLQHLAKQAVVRRQVHLRNLILQHPNCPSDVKRRG